MKVQCFFYGIIFIAFGLGGTLQSLVNFPYPYFYSGFGFILLIIGFALSGERE